MTLFKNKYRIESARKEGYDYSLNGAYFITICTKNKECFFGEIVNREMVYSDIGLKANEYWKEIAKHFDNAIIDEFIIMPNHIHGILILEKKENGHRRDVIFNVSNEEKEGDEGAVKEEAVKYNGSTEGQNNRMSEISPSIGSVSLIIRTFKSAVTKYANIHSIPFQWQGRFHDRIIRNAEEYERIRHYIINNPINWNRDEYFERIE